tara:strand:- start:269 stop:664 length:396 start_codon:yes stop_codon:yes gene_type:complete
LFEITGQAGGKLAQVVACGETLAGAGKEYAPDFGIIPGLFQSIAHGGVHGVGEGVLALWPVQPNDESSGFDFGKDEVSHVGSCGVILVWLGWYLFPVPFFTAFYDCFAICRITRQSDFLVNFRIPIFDDTT